VLFSNCHMLYRETQKPEISRAHVKALSETTSHQAKRNWQTGLRPAV
jgi:hypothetical protein